MTQNRYRTEVRSLWILRKLILKRNIILRKERIALLPLPLPPPLKPNHHCLCTSFPIGRLNSVLAEYMIWSHLLQVFFTGQYVWISWIILPTEPVDNFPNFEYTETSIHYWHMCCVPTGITQTAHMKNVLISAIWLHKKSLPMSVIQNSWPWPTILPE